MAKNEDYKVPVVNEEQTVIVSAPETNEAQEEAIEAVPVVKTKKELKKERKELKKHKKEVKKDAKRHSATTTKSERFWSAVLRLLVIVMMGASVYMLFMTYKAISGGTESAPQQQEQQNNDSANSNSQSSNSSSSSNQSSSSAPSGEPSSGENSENNAPGSDAPASGDLSTPAGIINYYKEAYNKALNAKTATKYYDNTLHYENYLEVGGNASLEKVGKQLMGMFMKEDTSEKPFSGGDIKANIPPAGKGVDGLTADICDASYKEEGNNYIITLKIKSTKENPDLGEKSGNLVSVIDEKTVTDAAGSLAKLNGLKNEYIGANVTATIDKTTGNLMDLQTDVPSFMRFDQVSVLGGLVKVDNVGVGLEYQQKWKFEY